jgi:sec-independent protein translocase protein TatB
MLDFAWSELLVVIVVAILVIGPKDIPKVMHGLGRLARRVHYLKFALSQQFEDLMKEHDLDELQKLAQKNVEQDAMKNAEPNLVEIDEASADADYIPPEENEEENVEDTTGEEVPDDKLSPTNSTRH